MVNTKDQSRSPVKVARQWAMRVVLVLALVGLAYPLSVGAVVAVETYSDYTCILLYEDAGTAEPWTAGRGPLREYFPNPGYTCTYLVDGEWVSIHEDLPGAKKFGFGASIAVAVVAIAGLAVIYRRQ